MIDIIIQKQQTQDHMWGLGDRKTNKFCSIKARTAETD